MKVKMILPALTEARSPYFRPIKYSLFPPLGLATLAGYLRPDDEVDLQDEHVERLRLEGNSDDDPDDDRDDDPDMVVIQVYITSASRAYEIADSYRARGSHVCLGGLHVTACPEEAAAHADSIFLGPGEDTWPEFLDDFRRGAPKRLYRSRRRSLEGVPRPRRDLVRRSRYLVPNSIVVSRGCPHRCDFCYKESFFRGGRSYYTRRVDEALAEIESLPGRHLYFLDDDLFADRRFALALFEGMRGMGRVWQGAATVKDILDRGRGGRTFPDRSLPERSPAATGAPGADLLERAAASGCSSLFVGFESLAEESLREQHKTHNLRRDYAEAIQRLKDHGVMVNASFVFGMDADGPDVFDRTVDWAVSHGVETATFHILTPYPGTALERRLEAQGRIVTRDWDLYDTRHAVFRPAQMTGEELERGYRRAYRRFYSWGSILRSARTEHGAAARLRHLAYTAGWKKLEPIWTVLIATGLLAAARPTLEGVLGGSGRRRPRSRGQGPGGEIGQEPSQAPCAPALSRST